MQRTIYFIEEIRKNNQSQNRHTVTTEKITVLKKPDTIKLSNFLIGVLKKDKTFVILDNFIMLQIYKFLFLYSRKVYCFLSSSKWLHSNNK